MFQFFNGGVQKTEIWFVFGVQITEHGQQMKCKLSNFANAVINRLNGNENSG